MPEITNTARFTNRYWIGLIAAVLVVCCFCWFLWCWWQPVTTVVVVRHAERSAVAGADPPLSPEGEARALELRHVLEDAGVTAAFATEFIRTQETVEPLATSQGLAVTEYPAGDAVGLANTIRSNHSGGVVLVAGHSNTVTEIIEALGGDPVGLLGESDYDNLFVVTLCRCAGRRVLHMKYGDST